MTLALAAVSLTIGGRRLLEPLSLEVGDGQVVTITGPSGAGKSSLLAHISGTLDPAFAATGRVLLDGRAVDGIEAHRRRIGLLFQGAPLFPHLSVAGNLLFAMPRSAGSRAQKLARVEEALASFGLAKRGLADPATLSGGERARVALLQAMLAEPRALLLDEPFASLDAERKDEIRALTFAEISARGIPALLVTHEPGDAPPGGSILSPWRADCARQHL